MRKKFNKGMSMIEILIGLAIFMILMIPIVSGIVQSLNMTTSAKALQSRNEFAEAVMEHVKSTNIDEIFAGKDADFYTNDLGSESVTAPVQSTTDVVAKYDLDGHYDGGPSFPDGSTYDSARAVHLTQTKYSISGTVKIGTKHEEYGYLVTIDNDYYVQEKAKNKDYADPNNMELGIVEDVDYNKVAVIDGTVWNYDFVTSQSLYAKKLLELKTRDASRYQQELSQSGGSSVFESDEGNRLTLIKIESKKESGKMIYTVSCNLSYRDSDSVTYTDDSGNVHNLLDHSKFENYVNYTPWSKTYEDKLPNIYLMYNPCYYRDYYCPKDYIAIDTSGLLVEDGAKPDVNVFLIETAGGFSSDIKAADAELKDNAVGTYDSFVDNNKDNTLYYDGTVMNGRTRNNVDVYFGILEDSDKQYIHLYHNFGGAMTSDDTKLHYDEANTTNEVLFKEFAKKISYEQNPSGGGLNPALAFYPLETENVKHVDQASEENRGLYEVKLYLKKGSDIPDPTNGDVPILSGTKGGSIR